MFDSPSTIATEEWEAKDWAQEELEDLLGFRLHEARQVPTCTAEGELEELLGFSKGGLRTPPSTPSASGVQPGAARVHPYVKTQEASTPVVVWRGYARAGGEAAETSAAPSSSSGRGPADQLSEPSGQSPALLLPTSYVPSTTSTAPCSNILSEKYVGHLPQIVPGNRLSFRHLRATGDFQHAFNHAMCHLGSLGRRKVFKIGITVDPHRRWGDQFIGYKNRGWLCMEVLIRSHCSVVRRLEIALIADNRRLIRCSNVGLGGEGMRDSNTDHGYLYVVHKAEPPEE
jgi:hypothetical protein